MDSYSLMGQAWKGLLIPALGQERTKVDRIIVGGILFKSKLAKCPSIKTAQESGGVVIKENKIHSFLYEIFTQVLCRKHRRFWARSGSKGRALGDVIGFVGLSQAFSEGGQVKTSVRVRVVLDSLELSIPKGTSWMIPRMENKGFLFIFIFWETGKFKYTTLGDIKIAKEGFPVVQS